MKDLEWIVRCHVSKLPSSATCTSYSPFVDVDRHIGVIVHALSIAGDVEFVSRVNREVEICGRLGGGGGRHLRELIVS